jgi:hypothetical protein
MANCTQFFLALIIMGVFVLAVFWGAATAFEGAVLYMVLLVAGILFVRGMMARRSSLR